MGCKSLSISYNYSSVSQNTFQTMAAIGSKCMGSKQDYITFSMPVNLQWLHSCIFSGYHVHPWTVLHALYIISVEFKRLATRTQCAWRQYKSLHTVFPRSNAVATNLFLLLKLAAIIRGWRLLEGNDKNYLILHI